MNRRVVGSVLAVAVVALAVPASSPGGAITVYVEAGDENRFSPRNAMYGLISSNFGWRWGDISDGGYSERRHNVRQDDRLFDSGDPRRTFNSGGYFQVSVSAGTFPYHCEVHGGPGGQGMAGKAKVAPADDSPEPDGVPVLWAVPESETGNRYDVRFKVDDGSWRVWKSDTSALEDVFGRDDDPVNFNGTRNYRIQARSQQGPDESRRSGWSPTLQIP